MRILLCLLCPILLTGCPAGLAPLVGTPAGQEVHKEVVVYDGMSLPVAEGERRLTIVAQDVDYNYDLIFSPDGNRKNVRLETRLHYKIRYENGETRALPFLEAKTSNSTSSRLQGLTRIAGTPYWVGYAYTYESNETNKDRSSRYYTFSVFSDSALRAHSDLRVARGPIRYDPALRALRYNGPAGPMLYLALENRSIAAP
jgi:hypothetical protein